MTEDQQAEQLARSYITAATMAATLRGLSLDFTAESMFDYATTLREMADQQLRYAVGTAGLGRALDDSGGLAAVVAEAILTLEGAIEGFNQRAKASREAGKDDHASWYESMSVGYTVQVAQLIAIQATL